MLVALALNHSLKSKHTQERGRRGSKSRLAAGWDGTASWVRGDSTVALSGGGVGSQESRGLWPGQAEGYSSLQGQLTCQFQFSRSVVFNSLQPHALQHTRPPRPSPTAGVYLNPSPLSR